MVDTVEISRVNIRDSLSVDVSVWMNHPNDMDFRPSLSVSGTTFTISSQSDGSSLASVELDVLVKAIGSTTVTVSVVVHPLASVIVTV